MSLNRIPVFVFPNILNYGPKTVTQTITLYNPYDFNVKYSLLCTKPNAFSVSGSEGVIHSRFCLDIVIRLLDESIVEEKFLITLKDFRNASNCGEKQLHVYKRCVDPSEHNNDSEDNNCHTFSPILQTQVNSSDVNQLREINARGMHTNNANNSNHVITYISAFVCILILLLPHESSPNNWFTICFTHKLVVAYILGLLTVLILRN